MSNDKTLATAKHGGCVQLGDGLLPCPFCGSPAQRIDLGPGAGDNEGGSCVACTRCQASGPVEFGYKENFVSDWNRRAFSAQPSTVETLPPEMRLDSPAYLDYLDAEPSPGGQGHAREVIVGLHDESTFGKAALLEKVRAARHPILPVRPVNADEAPFGLTTAEKVAWARGANDAIKEYAARQPVEEPVTVEAVATVRRKGDGDRYIDWLTEGGLADLEAGDVLMVSDRAVTDENGSGEVYTTPPAQPVGEPVGTVHSGKYASGMPWCEVEWHIPQPAGTKLYTAPSAQALIDGKPPTGV